MDYRCPHCHRMLDVRKLYFSDISACASCGQRVVLGDFLAFAFAALTMCASALLALYLLTQEFQEYYVAAGYAVAIGMASGIAVLVLLGRAIPFRKGRRVRTAQPAVKA
jgi:DNA-directed RNA polymerase subunit RPC12/RpoP